MPITFDTIPSNLRVPFTAVEFNSTRAQQGPSLLAYKALLIGQKLTAGTWTADSINRATSVDQVITGAGRGSIAHQQALAWFSVNRSTEAWFGVLADNGGGVAATGTIVVSGTATATSTLSLYLGGQRVTVGITTGDASTAVATAIGAAINANLDLPVTAGVASSTVTLTFRHKGIAGNTYDIRDSFRDGDVKPSAFGITLVITAMGGVVAGTLNPVLTTLLAGITDIWFQIVTHPYTDATSLSAIEAEMLARSGPLRDQTGLAITSASGSFATLAALGAGRNSPYSTIQSQTGATPLTPPMEYAAGVAGLVAFHGAADPARPFQTLALPTDRFVATAETDQFDTNERDLLLFTGIGTSKRVNGGVVQLDRVITTYQKSPSAAADTAYLDATTVLTLLYLRFDFRTGMQLRYPRHKLANDGTLFGSGQAVITPKIGKAEALMWFRRNEVQGLVEGFDQFKRDLVVERNLTDPNRLDFLLPPDLMNQLIVTAAQIQFRL